MLSLLGHLYPVSLIATNRNTFERYEPLLVAYLIITIFICSLVICFICLEPYACLNQFHPEWFLGGIKMGLGARKPVFCG